MKTWLNGQPADQLSLTDRGLSYGDGLFETIQIRQGCPLLLDAHRERMEQGARRLRFADDSVALLFADLAQISLPDTGVLKLTLTRGPGGRGYRLPEPQAVSRIIGLAPLPAFAGSPAEDGIVVRQCETQLGLNPLLAGIKHLNRLEQVLARAEWQSADIAEGIVSDLEGYLVEGTMSNLFWVAQGQLYTPQLDRCGVAGIVRNQLLVLAARAGLPVQEGRFRQEDLLAADEMFVCNSLIDIWPVRTYEGQAFTIGPIIRKLQKLLQQEYQV